MYILRHHVHISKLIHEFVKYEFLLFAEIKDDIMISQTVEILEPVLADSKSRGETPPLGAGDIEETKGRRRGCREIQNVIARGILTDGTNKNQYWPR